MKLDSNNHSVFLLYYHLVLVVKYRRKVFSELELFVAAVEVAEGVFAKVAGMVFS